MITEKELDDIAKNQGIILYDWQKEIIWNRSVKRWCILNGRKTGKTCAISYRTAVRMLNDNIPGVGLVGGICITSEGQDQAKAILEGIIAILAGAGWRVSKEKSRMSEENKIAYATSTQLIMPNGNRTIVKAVGLRGNALRPWSFHEKTHDEADLQNESVFVSTSACLARFDGIEILDSTPNPETDNLDSYFMRAFFGRMPGYKVMCIPTSMVTHLPPNFLDDEKKRMTRTQFEREYECKIRENASAVFDRDTTIGCLNNNRINFEALESNPDVQKYIGFSLPRFGEDTMIAATNYVIGDMNYVKIKIIEDIGQRMTQVEGIITSMLNQDPRILCCVLDETSVGTAVTDSLASLFGELRIMGVSGNQRIFEMEGMKNRLSPEDMVQATVKLMEQGKILFDQDNRIIASLLTMKYKYTASGRVQIFANDGQIAWAVIRSLLNSWNRKTFRGEIIGSIRFF